MHCLLNSTEKKNLIKGRKKMSSIIQSGPCTVSQNDNLKLFSQCWQSCSVLGNTNCLTTQPCLDIVRMAAINPPKTNPYAKQPPAITWCWLTLMHHCEEPAGDWEMRAQCISNSLTRNTWGEHIQTGEVYTSGSNKQRHKQQACFY